MGKALPLGSRWLTIRSTMPHLQATRETKPKMILLEHDNRFAVFSEFVFYDFAQPVKLPGAYTPLRFMVPLPPSKRSARGVAPNSEADDLP